jgi:hypothetical protein
MNRSAFLLQTLLIHRLAVHSSASASALSAEASWSPKDASAWKETDYEAELVKLEKEAEDRLDAKIEEMMTKIETTGAGK